MTQINDRTIKIQGAKIHYKEVLETAPKTILFLHGGNFSSQTWQDLGTLDLMATSGYHVVAVDLPGYGESEMCSLPRHKFLLELMAALDLKSPVVISPSMSGGFSLPLVAQNFYKLSGFVAVAPVAIGQFIQQLQGIPLPTLAIWGSNDSIVPVSQADLLIKAMPNARKMILENAGHACYMRATEDFHENLLHFLETIFN